MISQKKQTHLSLLLEPLFARLEAENVQYCVCGNYINLPYHTKNDVDIWAKSPDIVVKHIEQICTNIQYKVYLKNSNAIGSNLFLYAIQGKQSILIHLDVLQECRWHSFLPLVQSKVIEHHRKLHNDFWVASEVVDAAMHFMYPLAYFGKITSKYHDDIRKEAQGDAFWEIVQNGWGKTFTEKISPLMAKGSWTQIEKEFSQNKFNLTLRSLIKMRGPEIKSGISFIISNIKRLVKPNGLFIAFVGPDGCGKTTIQNNLQPFFQKGFTKGKIKKFYWRPFLLPRIKSLFSNTNNNTPSVDEASEEPSARLALREVGLGKQIIHSIKLVYYWLDYIIGRVKYQGAWSRGGVVCFDRYWGDLLIFPERFGLNVPKWLVKSLGFFIPRPDIVFYLHAAPEVLIGRKPELPFAEMKSQTEQYSALCHQYENYSLINGDQPEAAVLADVIRTCLNKMASRYPQNQ